MTTDICFGFLDNRDAISIPYLAEKMKTLTELHVTRLYQAVPSFTSTNIDEILEWFSSQYTSRYLVLVKYGTLINDRRLIQRSISQLCRHEAMVKGGLKCIDNYWYLTDDFLVIDRVMYEKLLEPRWGQEGSDVQKIQTTMEFQDTKRLVATDGLHLGSSKSTGWGLVQYSMLWDKPVIDLDLEDHTMMHVLTPEDGTEELLHAFIRYNPQGLFVKTFTQHQYLRSCHFAAPGVRDSVEVFDTGEHQGVCGTQKEIRNLVCRAKGFRHLMILRDRNFKPHTKVYHIDHSEPAIIFRKALNTYWDGTDLPAFIAKYEKSFGFEFKPRLINQQAAWEDVQKTFGGPREFKMLWDAYRRLDHRYSVMDLAITPESAADLIPSDPATYVWFDDAFCSDPLYTTVDNNFLRKSYEIFMDRVRLHNPFVVFDGRDWTGRWV